MSVGKYSASCDSIGPKHGASVTINSAVLMPSLEHYTSTALQSGTLCTLDVYGFREGDVFNVTSWSVSPAPYNTTTYPAPVGMPLPVSALQHTYLITYKTDLSVWNICKFTVSTAGVTQYRTSFDPSFWNVPAPVAFSYRFVV